jgi:extracellular elastinolytic metalloproteinase
MHSTLLASFLSIVLVGAHPTGHDDSLHRRAVDLNAFRLKAASEYVNASITESLPSVRRAKRGDYVETATELVKTVVNGATFRVVEDHYIGSSGIAHVNLKQTANGIDIDNADFNVNVSMLAPYSPGILLTVDR